MSNFKNALKMQELIEANANLKHENKTLKDFQKIDKNRISSLKEECKKQKELVGIFSRRLEDAVVDRNHLEAELEILKNYFKLKL